MPRIGRRTFDYLVFTGALSLPLLAMFPGAGQGGAATSPAETPGAASRIVATAASMSSTPAAIDMEAAAAATVPRALGVVARPGLSYRTSWIGNTWGYANQRWVQIDVAAIAVTPEGDVFTNAPWDEGGGEIGHYRDGQLLGYGGESHSWGKSGGDAIAVNNDYVFVAQLVSSQGAKAAIEKNLPPEGVEWYGVSRRLRSDIRKGVPFEGQMNWAGSPNTFLRIATSPASEDQSIHGLAADATTLFVSNIAENRVEIFDARSMQPTGSFPVHEPGRLALAPDGSLWIIEGIRTDGSRRVVHYKRDGTPTGELTLPPDTVPVDLTLDARGRLFIADNGPRQQVLIFTAADAALAPDHKLPDQSVHGGSSMRLSATLGETGGIYAGRAGAVGPLRFNGLTGVGVDRAGNVYVSMNNWGPRGFDSGTGHNDGALIESYTPDGKRRFSLQGLLFVDGAQFAGGDPPSVYSGSKRFTLDLSRPPGQEWSYAGYTADRFHYPWDPLFHMRQGNRGMPLVRDVDGRRLLFTIDMTSECLRIYRFTSDSEIAIPSGMFSGSHIAGAWPPKQPPAGEWIWRDTAGKSRFAVRDFEQTAGAKNAPTLGGWWVDERGAVWEATESTGIRRFPLEGFDSTGNPVYHYASMQLWPMPSGFTRIDRLNYVAADDTLFVSGSTPERPYVSSNWNSAGSTLARYDHWTSGHPVLRYMIDLPDQGPPETQAINGFAVEGDYIFAAETMTGIVRVYERATGRDAGRLVPGPEVGATSGWIDVSMPVTAHRLASGEYLVFVEEDAHGKVMMYRVTPPPHPVAVSSLTAH
ncbi:NHL repeat-containing protein [Paraburkholderia gardini]|uniref:NHL repeat-containing protein n=1 Tax=Paraburkholderia gardini TaxID=2823469 RepID=A0ABN7QFL7_9BURK|nr:hypothetical protein [Paraburkholderia gardini]CAG4888383.1 hypothetical protein R54767_00551 [Paraburkholderia gardini]